jgi:hypothetical protein
MPPCPDCGAGGPFTKAFTHRDGCRGSEALRARMIADAAWFEAHPGETQYIRDVEPADLEVDNGDDVRMIGEVTVKLIATGVRVRSFGKMAVLIDPGNISLSTKYLLAHPMFVKNGVNPGTAFP